MPEPVEILSVPEDGRQSPQAAAIARGVRRLMWSMGFATVTELVLASGRRADVVGVSAKGEIWIVEIKSSVADWRADCKWPEYRDYCDRLLFAVARDFPVELLPDDTGLMIADQYGADLVREAPSTPLAGARRKAVTLRFARAAAWRLQALADPNAMGVGSWM